MAHFAELNDENVVVRVLVTDNSLADEGYGWLVENLGGTWVKTSYNTHGGVHSSGGTPLRKNYAGVGFTYDSDLDAFIPLKPFESWILNEETCLWEAPMPRPEGRYRWDESVVNWVEVQGE
jgi:hypothetical protein